MHKCAGKGKENTPRRTSAYQTTKMSTNMACKYHLSETGLKGDTINLLLVVSGAIAFFTLHGRRIPRKMEVFL